VCSGSRKRWLLTRKASRQVRTSGFWFSSFQSVQFAHEYLSALQEAQKRLEKVLQQPKPSPFAVDDIALHKAQIKVCVLISLFRVLFDFPQTAHVYVVCANVTRSARQSSF
jgi:hypothetical protein